MISLVNHSYVKAKGGYANNLLFHTKVTVRRDHVLTVTTKPPSLIHILRGKNQKLSVCNSRQQSDTTTPIEWSLLKSWNKDEEIILSQVNSDTTTIS